MELFNYLKEYLHIDPIIVLIVIAAGFFVKRFLRTIHWIKDERTDEAVKTLLVSFSVSMIYLLLVKTPREMWAQYFLSYFMATSMYEIIIRPAVKFIQKKIAALTGEKDEEDEPKPKP